LGKQFGEALKALSFEGAFSRGRVVAYRGIFLMPSRSSTSHHSQLFYYVYFLLYYSFVGFGFGFSTSFYASAA